MKKKILKIFENFFALCANFYIKKHKPYIVGITGSVGKTSCREIISQVLSQSLRKQKIIYTSPKNFNSELGLVFSIFQIESFQATILELFRVTQEIISMSLFGKKAYDVIVLEYGIDHPGDMDFLLKIAKPDIAVFTKLDKVHAEYFETATDIWSEKSKLLHSAQSKIYLNFLDDSCKKYVTDFHVDTQFYNTGKIQVLNYRFEKNKEEQLFAKFVSNNVNITTNVLGLENAQYISLALEILKNFQESEKIFDEKNFYFNGYLQEGRFSIFKGIANSFLIDSTYNATFMSMKQMIENTQNIKDTLFSNYKLGYVLGDMRELGENSEEEHKKLSQIIEDADTVFMIGPETQKYLTHPQKKHFLNAKKAGVELREFLETSSDNYIILFKGSQNTIYVEETLREVLYYSNDTKKLVRTNNFWMNKKQKFFKSF